MREICIVFAIFMCLLTFGLTVCVWSTVLRLGVTSFVIIFFMLNTTICMLHWSQTTHRLTGRLSNYLWDQPPPCLYHVNAWAHVRPSLTLFFLVISKHFLSVLFFFLKGRLRSSLFFTDDGGQIARKLENNLNGGDKIHNIKKKGGNLEETCIFNYSKPEALFRYRSLAASGMLIVWVGRPRVNINTWQSFTGHVSEVWGICVSQCVCIKESEGHYH